MTSPLLDRVVDRQILEGHDGRSGAHIERVRLDDGTLLVVKRADPRTDITVAATGGIDRERRLWESGVLDRLPVGVGHAILDVFDDDGRTVTVMRDLGDAVPGWSRVLSFAECGRILDALTGMHAAFASHPPADLCPLERRLGLLSPPSMHRVELPDHALPPLVLRGWERFAELVPDDVAQAVSAVHGDTGRLAAAMREGTTTLLHADLWLVNLALLPDRVVLLDWAIATEGPPALDFAIFLTGLAAHVEPSREDLIGEFRVRSGALTDDSAMALGLLAGLAEMGWNKALDAAEHDDPVMRQRERADLDWWVAQVRDTIDRYPL